MKNASDALSPPVQEQEMRKIVTEWWKRHRDLLFSGNFARRERGERGWRRWREEGERGSLRFFAGKSQLVWGERTDRHRLELRESKWLEGPGCLVTTASSTSIHSLLRSKWIQEARFMDGRYIETIHREEKSKPRWTRWCPSLSSLSFSLLSLGCGCLFCCIASTNVSSLSFFSLFLLLPRLKLLAHSHSVV